MSSLFNQGSKDLIVVSNNCGYYEEGSSKINSDDRIAKIICSFPYDERELYFHRKSLGRQN